MNRDTVAERIVEVLGHKPAGLFSDFDGALSEIAPTPDGAVAFPGAAEALNRIASAVDVAGIISGRAVDDVGRKVTIDNLTVVGNHGLEWWQLGKSSDHPAGTAAIDAIDHVMDATKRELAKQADLSGMIWENKRLSATIHVRNTSNPEAMEALLVPIVQSLAEKNGLRWTAGKMIVELRPEAIVTKGTAVAELVATAHLASIVFIGDDVTDVDGFRTLHELRQKGKHTLAVGVVALDAHPDVEAYADVTVSSVEELVSTLTLVADKLQTGI